MKKSHSLIFKLLAPIAVTTVLLLLLSVATVSRIYQHQTEQTAIQSNLEILNQTDVSLGLIHDRISQIAAIIQQTPYLQNSLEASFESVQDEWKSRQRLSEIFSNSPLAMVDYEIILIGTNGISVSSGNGGVTLDYDDFFELDVYQRARASGHIIYDGRQEGFTYATQGTSIIYGCKTLSDSTGDFFGIIFLSVPEYSLRQFYQSFSSRSTNILLLSSEGKILSSNIEEDIGTYNTDLLQTVQESQKTYTDYTRTEEHTIVLSRYINTYDAYAISQINSSLLYHESGSLILSVLTICITLLVLCFLVAFIIRKNLKPLRTLAEHMADSQDIPSPVHITGSIEMEQISMAYSQMINSMNDYIEKLHQAHEQQRKDELNLLQMQINPHFLYNTLDSVKHLIEMNNTGDACRTIVSLISLFRSTLSKNGDMATVADELNNIKNYIAIVEPRYGGLIHAEAEADSDCLNLEIPNLLLQPLIENAFFHAFQKTRTGSIRVLIYQDQKMLFCEITDSGDGMSEELTAQLLTSREGLHSINHVGVRNVRERLEILYPEKNSFEITSEPGYGTCIILSFPARKSKPSV